MARKPVAAKAVVSNGLPHSYDPNQKCEACQVGFAKGSSGCHRLRDGRYADDPESMKRRESTVVVTADPWSGG